MPTVDIDDFCARLLLLKVHNKDWKQNVESLRTAWKTTDRKAISTSSRFIETCLKSSYGSKIPDNINTTLSGIIHAPRKAVHSKADISKDSIGSSKSTEHKAPSKDTQPEPKPNVKPTKIPSDSKTTKQQKNPRTDSLKAKNVQNGRKPSNDSGVSSEPSIRDQQQESPREERTTSKRKIHAPPTVEIKSRNSEMNTNLLKIKEKEKRIGSSSSIQSDVKKRALKEHQDESLKKKLEEITTQMKDYKASVIKLENENKKLKDEVGKLKDEALVKTKDYKEALFKMQSDNKRLTDDNERLRSKTSLQQIKEKASGLSKDRYVSMVEWFVKAIERLQKFVSDGDRISKFDLDIEHSEMKQVQQKIVKLRDSQIKTSDRDTSSIENEKLLKELHNVQQEICTRWDRLCIFNNTENKLKSAKASSNNNSCLSGIEKIKRLLEEQHLHLVKQNEKKLAKHDQIVLEVALIKEKADQLYNRGNSVTEKEVKPKPDKTEQVNDTDILLVLKEVRENLTNKQEEFENSIKSNTRLQQQMTTTTERLKDLLASCLENEHNTIDDDKQTQPDDKAPADIETIIKSLKQQIKVLKTNQQNVTPKRMDSNDNMENIIKSIVALHSDICVEKQEDIPITENSETITNTDQTGAVKLMADIHETLQRKQKEIDRKHDEHKESLKKLSLKEKELKDMENEQQKHWDTLKVENEKLEHLRMELQSETKDQDMQENIQRLRSENTDLTKTIVTLREKQKEIEDDKEELFNRLSKIASAQLTDGNTNITDLSDSARPSKIAEQYMELYSNEWLTAFELLDKKEEKEGIQILLHILQEVYGFCSQVSQTQTQCLKLNLMCPVKSAESSHVTHDTPMGQLNAKMITDLKKQTASESSEDLKRHFKKNNKDMTGVDQCTVYVDKCIELCWLMCVQSPMVYIDTDFNENATFNTNVLRDYTQRGKTIDFLVWPPIFITKDGSLLGKGVAQGK